jgi:hypothetical protein
VREIILQTAFAFAAHAQNPQFPIKSALPLLGTPSRSQKRHKPANGTGIARDPEDTNPVKRRSGLTLRLVVERYVAIDWTQRRVREEQCRRRLAARRFISSSKGNLPCGNSISSLFQFQAQCAAIVPVESNSNF